MASWGDMQTRRLSYRVPSAVLTEEGFCKTHFLKRKCFVDLCILKVLHCISDIQFQFQFICAIKQINE